MDFQNNPTAQPVGLSLSALAGQPIASIPPSHDLQPQGVDLAIPLGTALFYPVEFVEDGQITLPNFVTVIGKANAGTATLVINDGLLRTHLDSMVFAVNNTGGGDVILHLSIAKKPVTDYTHALSDDYFSQTITTTIKADERRHLELRHVAGQYVIADRNLALPEA